MDRQTRLKLLHSSLMRSVIIYMLISLQNWQDRLALSMVLHMIVVSFGESVFTGIMTFWRCLCDAVLTLVLKCTTHCRCMMEADVACWCS